MCNTLVTFKEKNCHLQINMIAFTRENQHTSACYITILLRHVLSRSRNTLIVIIPWDMYFTLLSV